MNKSPEFGRLKEPEEPRKERCKELNNERMRKRKRGYHRLTHTRNMCKDIHARHTKLGSDARKANNKKESKRKKGRNERIGIGMGVTARLNYISRRARGGHQKCQNKGRKSQKRTKMVYGVGSLSFPQGFTPIPTLVDSFIKGIIC